MLYQRARTGPDGCAEHCPCQTTSVLPVQQDLAMTSPSSTFGAGVHPDVPTFITHFVGRSRGGSAVPWWSDPSPENRMTAILQGGCLRLDTVFGTSGPVVCFSEVSQAGIEKFVLDWRHPTGSL